MAQFLDRLRSAEVTWMITARRCLLSGVSVFPVTAPLATTGKSAFPRVRALTRLLRHNPLALDIASALVSTGAIGTAALGRWLVSRGVERVRAVDHEDDLPEVSLLVEWAWHRFGSSERRILSSLARLTGDHAATDSLFELARVERAGKAALAKLRRWHLVQEPFRGRFALHAVVRHAIRKIGDRSIDDAADARRIVEHYLSLLERSPERLDLEQTHLFAAMDFAHSTSDLDATLRIDRLLRRLDATDT
jgi:hypothetical protein